MQPNIFQRNFIFPKAFLLTNFLTEFFFALHAVMLASLAPRSKSAAVVLTNNSLELFFINHAVTRASRATGLNLYVKCFDLFLLNPSSILGNPKCSGSFFDFKLGLKISAQEATM